MTGANMPRCLQRGALFDFEIYIFSRASFFSTGLAMSFGTILDFEAR